MLEASGFVEWKRKKRAEFCKAEGENWVASALDSLSLSLDDEKAEGGGF